MDRSNDFLKQAGAVSRTLPLPNPSYRDSGYAELSESARSNKRNDHGYEYMRSGPPRLYQTLWPRKSSSASKLWTTCAWSQTAEPDGEATPEDFV